MCRRQPRLMLFWVCCACFKLSFPLFPENEGHSFTLFHPLIKHFPLFILLHLGYFNNNCCVCVFFLSTQITKLSFFDFDVLWKREASNKLREIRTCLNQIVFHLLNNVKTIASLSISCQRFLSSWISTAYPNKSFSFQMLIPKHFSSFFALWHWTFRVFTESFGL